MTPPAPKELLPLPETLAPLAEPDATMPPFPDDVAPVSLEAPELAAELPDTPLRPDAESLETLPPGEEDPPEPDPVSEPELLWVVSGDLSGA